MLPHHGPRRKRSLLWGIVGVFAASLVLLLGGIHQTSHLSQHHHNISFDPPVASFKSRMLKNISISNNSIKNNEDVTNKKRVSLGQAREAAQAQQQTSSENDANANTDDNNMDLDNVNIKEDKGENVTVTDLRPKSFPYSPKVKYLGVLIDAGRHYFPIAWLKDLIDTLHRMHYNFIHFRLTDDQTFNIRLESHPELAKPSPVNNPDGLVYSVEELMDLIEYASEKNFTIMPEINIPGHAGAWGGIPNFLVPCPAFICLKGYGECDACTAMEWTCMSPFLSPPLFSLTHTTQAFH